MQDTQEYRPPPILVTALCHAFNGRSILGQSYFQHCMMKSLLLFSAVGGELVSDPEAEVKVITFLQNCVLLPQRMISSLSFFSVGRRIFHSHFLFIHLIITSTWNKIFKYGNKTNIFSFRFLTPAIWFIELNLDGSTVSSLLLSWKLLYG